MAQVSNLIIKKQSGTDNTHFASWDFNENTKSTTTSSGAVKEGDLVSIKSGSTWYNGVGIDSWVFNHRWYVYELRGLRAVVHRNESGSNAIMSPIHVGNLVGGSSSPPSTTTTNTLENYSINWYYDTGDGVWFSGGSSTTKEKNATYGAPEGALRIKVIVKPVSKTYQVNGADASYWTGTDSVVVYAVEVDPPETPTTPTVAIEKYKLTATIENVTDPRTDEIEFQIYDGITLINSAAVTVVTARASFSDTVAAGGEYRVRCRSINLYGNSKIYGKFSPYSSSLTTIPTVPENITTIKASSSTAIYLEWTPVSTADTYDIEYTTNKNYFDGSDQTTVISNVEFNRYEKTGLESGKEYFFRVRAVNDKGHSAWTENIKSVVIGKKPVAPTTWSSTTTAIVGEPLTLYWVHNVEDGSSMTYAELELTIDGRTETYTIKNTDVEDEKDKTKFYPIDTSPYDEGTKIQWRVRTAGITKVYGLWSVLRVIDIFAPPTLKLVMANLDGTQIDTLNMFPFTISALPGPKTQAPTAYHLVITSTSVYETTDNIGNRILVNNGDEVYSKYFDIDRALEVQLSASDLDLENGVTYKVTCTVSMNSGLTKEESLEFKVSWVDLGYEPDAEISVDRNILVSYIKPYCIDEDGYLIKDILLSVYRREFDGSFVEIAIGLNNVDNTVVTDPHPSLDYARYRIVATTQSTGAICFYDTPGYPIQEKAAIIQWSEDWSNFSTNKPDAMEQPSWAGSMLKLPYNIDVSDSSDPDVSLIKYVGRKHPVSYYGTQLDSKQSWSVDIPKTDKDTLYAIRRLSVWSEDVYVREPSGSGYWANITVSYNIKHNTLVIPISFDITRVEGGM